MSITPITREEALMNGDYIEPITREEMILVGEDIEPITRREWFLKKYRGGGGVEVVTLHANENTTYVAPEGQAYSPVVVNVPEPVLKTKTITANGTYSASADNADGYSQVTVAVDGFKKKSIANTPTDIASFNDGTANPMPSLKISIEPQQDLHGYDYPWAGGSGKNKLDTSGIDGTVSEVTYKADANGIVTINGTKYGNSYAPFTNASITLKGGVQYTFSIRLVSGTIRDNTETGLRSLQCYLTSSDGTNIASVSTVNENSKNRSVLISPTEDTTAYVNFAWWSDNTIITNAVIEMQVEEGSTATAWEPYSNICPISGWDEANIAVSPTTDAEDGTTYTIQFRDGDNPLTVYGGTLDVVNGMLTVDRAYADMGTFIWTKESWGSGGVDFYTTLSIAKLPPDDNTKGNIISSQYENLTRNEIYNSSDDGISLLQGGVLKVRDSRYSEGDAIAFKTAMNGVQLVYELATPQTIQLTPTQVNSLLGQNNIFADCGQVLEGEYFVTL